MGLPNRCQGEWVLGTPGCGGAVCVRSGVYVMNERAVSNAWVGGGCRGRCGPARPPPQGCVGTGSLWDSPQCLPLLMGGSPPVLPGDRAGACPRLAPAVAASLPSWDAAALAVGSALAWPGSPRAFQALIGSEREGGRVIPSYGMGEESQDMTEPGSGCQRRDPASWHPQRCRDAEGLFFPLPRA